MIEQIILDYLADQIDVDIFLEQPEEKPDKYILVEKTGSSKTNLINHATFALQSYAPTMYDAAYLNELIKSAMDRIIVLNEIGSSRLNSDYNFTDTTRKECRYQAVYDITHY